MHAATTAGAPRFAGKVAFASTGAGATAYLTTVFVKSSDMHLPEMVAANVGAGERCILYARDDGTVAIQLGSLLWIALDEGLGWLVTTTDLAHAAAFTLDAARTTWKVATSSGSADVWYSTHTANRVMSINGGDAKVFAPTVLTPSLDAIVAAKGAPGADLADVDLRAAELGNLDLSHASLARTRLDGATLHATKLVGAVLDGATIGSATFDAATLDNASFAGASLVGAKWGAPASARGISLQGCHGAGAVLGGQATPLDCTAATLTDADLRRADLRGLLLKGASAAGALLSGCDLRKASLDEAMLSDAVAVGADLAGASLKGAVAQGASFVRANLTSADLTRARMGARAWLATIADSFAGALDTMAFVQPALIAAFAGFGVTLATDDHVVVVASGTRWRIVDAGGPFDLILSKDGGIDVYSAHPDLRPAALRGAICEFTVATGASLSGADLRGVAWHASPAKLDHADLENASLAGSYLAATDFTQALLDGADLSGCVLVQAKLAGCRAGLGSSGRPLSLERSLLQGVSFADAQLRAALLADAAVAVDRGVPLFTLPSSAAAHMTTQGLSSLADDFATARRPLGTGATVAEQREWLIDNAADPDKTVPATYRVASVQGQLDVYDAAGGGPALFVLDPAYADDLDAATASAELCTAFQQAGFSLVAAAPIDAEQHWEITIGAGTTAQGIASYPRLRVYADPGGLPVYGSVIVDVDGWPGLVASLAFGPTLALDVALDQQSLGPSGEPRSWVQRGLVTREQLLTAGPGLP